MDWQIIVIITLFLCMAGVLYGVYLAQRKREQELTGAFVAGGS